MVDAPKIDAEWVDAPMGMFLVVKDIPLKYFADADTANAIFQRAQLIADEKAGGAKADH